MNDNLDMFPRPELKEAQTPEILEAATMAVAGTDRPTEEEKDMVADAMFDSLEQAQLDGKSLEAARAQVSREIRSVIEQRFGAEVAAEIYSQAGENLRNRARAAYDDRVRLINTVLGQQDEGSPDLPNRGIGKDTMLQQTPESREQQMAAAAAQIEGAQVSAQ